MDKRSSWAKRTFICFLAAVLMISCFAGCGDSPSEGSGGAGSSEQPPSEASSAASSPESSEDAAGDSAPVKLKLFVENTWWYYKEWAGRIPELATAATGVDFEVTVAADENALNLLIASGDMGDIVLSEAISRMNDGQICYDLDSLAQQYGMDISGIGEVMRFVNTANDGKLYSILCGFSPEKVMEEYEAVVEGEGVICRTDILEELGYKQEDINGIADFEEVLAKVKENYPEMVPVVWCSSNYCRVPNILFGARREEDGFVEQDGQLYTFIQDPKMKNAYMLLNKWSRLGYITEENFGFQTGNEDLEYFLAGKAFANIYYGNSAEFWNSDILPKANADFTVTQLINIWNEPTAEFIQKSPGWRGLYIPKSCKDPEAALRFNLWAWSDEGRHTLLWGEEGVDWTWSEDHTYPKLNWSFENPNMEDGMKYWGWTNHNGYDNTAPQKSNAGTTLASYEKLTSILRMAPVMGMIRVPPDTQEEVIMNNLKQLERTERINIVTAPTEAEALAAYDNMIKMAEEIGANQLVEWATPFYEEKSAAYEEIRQLPG